MIITKVSDREIALRKQLEATRDLLKKVIDVSVKLMVDRDTLRQQLAEARRDAFEEAANAIVGAYGGITAVMCSNLVRKMKDET